MSWLVLRLCPAELDRGRCLALATLHDLPEVRVGDLTPYDGVSEEEKHAREDQAAADLLADRPDLLALVREYTAQQSSESRFVRDLDKLDMALQALVYGQSVDTREFIDSALRSAQTDQVRGLIAAIHARLPA
jgi:putative hydrolase of HD superfamily